MKKPVTSEKTELTLETLMKDIDRNSLIKEPFIINGHGFPGHLVEVSEDLKYYTIEVRGGGWVSWVQQVLVFGDWLYLHRTDKGITIPTTLVFSGYLSDDNPMYFIFKLKVHD